MESGCLGTIPDFLEIPGKCLEGTWKQPEGRVVLVTSLGWRTRAGLGKSAGLLGKLQGWVGGTRGPGAEEPCVSVQRAELAALCGSVTTTLHSPAHAGARVPETRD